MNKFQSWLMANKNLLITSVVMCQVLVLSIGIINFPYIDDTGRQIDGNTDFARSYSRWGSEIGSWLVQGSRHLTDMGLWTHILSGFIVSVTGIIIVYSFHKKLSLLALTAAMLVGFNPWFLQNLSFRFDSPYMSLSLLFSVLPFLFWNKNKVLFLVVSILSIFLMCNTYQASSGIYVVMVLALSLKQLLDNQSFIAVLKKAIVAMISYISAMFLYLIETKFNPEIATRGGMTTIASVKDMISYISAMFLYLIETKFNPEIATRGGMTTIASVKDIPKTILVNSQMYLSKITEQSTKLWILLFFILVIFFVLSTVLNAKVSPVKSFLYAVLFLFLGSILSYGVFLIFPEKLLLISPRYGYGFSFFVVSIIMLTLSNTSKNVLGYVSKTAVCLFCVYLLSFTFVYASALSHQKESFERQSMILADDLKDLVNRDTVTVHSTSLFKDSPVFANSSKNYPILKELVPPNEALYWPNQFLFRTYTGLNVNMEIFDINALNKEESELMKSNYYHDIYVKDSEVFVHVK
ncbi:glucosyltransferase domain-containing protein (plasmid) [Enterococcus faecalis]|uniref:Glucosyltransferase domain-containing protein n=21 Tax=Bacteria TaxID=2 RepID=A0ABD7XSX3_ENTFL|nr:glucosyltransferase domain-containing protein [Enterococcus faecalis]WER44386.1 glucosyltransferase domain-containing protein [Enterococcus faecalis]